MGDIPLPNAELLGFWFQILATGVYYVYFPQCMSILWNKRRRDSLSLWFPGVCLIMFIVVTVELVNGMVRAYQAFGVSGANGEIAPDPNLYYANSSTPLSLLKNSMIVALAIISDFIIVYRTFIVWNFSFLVIAIPAGLLCADIAFGIWATYTLAHTPFGDTPILEEVAVRVKYFFIFTFCINMLCAGLICFRIWRISKRSSPWTTSDRTTSRVFEVVTESAAFYCAHLFALIVSDALGSNVFFIFLDFLPPVTALVFSMLIVGTRTGTKIQTTATATSAHLTDSRFWPTTRSSMRGPTQGSGFGGAGGGVGAGGVEINLERVVRTDSGVFPTRTGAESSFVSEQSKVPDFTMEV
ncbi:hypothetical protein C8Q80DRAFT_236278 [Daedaleopsis nitida]|nr:hypothetical protein C8Q80DRAFT_236278 [Daedaleopsis nitida]